MRDSEKKYFSSSCMFFINTDENISSSAQPEPNNASQEPKTYGPSTFLEYQENRLKEESNRLDTIDSKLEYMQEECYEKRRHARSLYQDYTRILNSLDPTVSDFSLRDHIKMRDYENKVSSIVAGLDASDHEQNMNRLKIEAKCWQTSYQNDINQLDFFLHDPNANFSRQDRERFLAARTILENCKNLDLEMSHIRIKHAEQKKDLDEQLYNLNSKKDQLLKEKLSDENKCSSNNKSSLVDDFADTSTEMPSYMDPED